MQFRKQEVSCLDDCLSQPQTLELTQELKLPEGSAGVQRILGTWGQALMRSKEWLGDSVHLAGGILVWVLYEPEDGSGLKCLDSWIPFRMDWDLPEHCPEGSIRIRPMVRSAETRAVSAGKLLIRAGIAAWAEGFSPCNLEVSVPETLPEDMELLRSQWPVRMLKEAGEKPFELEEELVLPGSVPSISRVVSFSMTPLISDRKILANKIVFRGNGNLHVVYLDPEGILRSWDFELPFSQYGELQGSHSADAQGDVTMAVTRLELEQNGEGTLHLRAGLTGQYLVDDRETLETVEDGFSPYRAVELKREDLMLPVQLDSRREMVSAQQILPIQADTIADHVFLPDIPRQHREGDTIQLMQPGMVQILFYDPEGRLQSAVHRMEGELPLKLDQQAHLAAVPQGAELQLHPGGDSLRVQAELPVAVTAYARQQIPMVTAIEPGETRCPDPERPSLILRRAGKARLWDIARESGSTVSAIRMANSLEGEPEPGKMLLIPVK